MGLVIRTDAKNVQDLIRKYKLYLEGTTEKMCMVSGNQNKIIYLKKELDNINVEYFNHNRSDETSKIKATESKVKRKS